MTPEERFELHEQWLRSMDSNHSQFVEDLALMKQQLVDSQKTFAAHQKVVAEHMANVAMHMSVLTIALAKFTEESDQRFALLEAGHLKIQEGFARLEAGHLQMQEGFVQLEAGDLKIQEGFVRIEEEHLKLQQEMRELRSIVELHARAGGHHTHPAG